MAQAHKKLNIFDKILILHFTLDFEFCLIKTFFVESQVISADITITTPPSPIFGKNEGGG